MNGEQEFEGGALMDAAQLRHVPVVERVIAAMHRGEDGALCLSVRHVGVNRWDAQLRVREMVKAIAKDVFVTCSVDIAPKWGEYERVTATALNAYLGPVMSGYLERLDTTLTGLGYSHGLQIAQCGGGTARSSS